MQQESPMTSSHLATLVSLFIILVGATYLVANPDRVLAADRGNKLVSQAVDPAGKPLQIVQAERTQKQTASQKGVVRADHLVILFHGIRGRGSVMQAVVSGSPLMTRSCVPSGSTQRVERSTAWSPRSSNGKGSKTRSTGWPSSGSRKARSWRWMRLLRVVGR